MDLVGDRARASVFLSGDVHHAEIITSPARCELPYELVEITSSGMTHGILDEVPRKFGFARAFVRRSSPRSFRTWLWPDVGGLQRARFIQHNFGEVAIDFGDEDEEGEDAEGEHAGGVARGRRTTLARRRRPAHPTTDEATGSIRLNIRGKTVR